MTCGSRLRHEPRWAATHEQRLPHHAAPREPMTLRSRIRLAACAVALVLVALAVPQLSGTRQEITPLTRTVQVAVEHMLRSGSRAELDQFLSALIDREPEILSVRVLDPPLKVDGDRPPDRRDDAGERPGQGWATPVNVAIAEALATGPPGHGGRAELVALRPWDDAVDGALEVVVAIPQTVSLRTVAILLGFTLFAFVATLDVVLGWLVLRPLTALTTAMRNLTRGGPAPALSAGRSD